MKLAIASAVFMGLCASGCGHNLRFNFIPEQTIQKRVVVSEKYSCNLAHVNAKKDADQRTLDLLLPNNRLTPSYKTECSSEGYSADKINKTSELDAVIAMCQKVYKTIHSQQLDAFLALGGKVVGTSEFVNTVSIFDNENNLQPGNECIGKEYILEGKPAWFDVIR